MMDMRFQKLHSPTDLRRLEGHLIRLDPVSRTERFDGMSSDDTIRTHCLKRSRDFLLGVGWFGADGHLHAVAEMMPLGDGSGCELAVSVEHQHQGHGIGSALVRRAVQAAGERGWHHVVAHVTGVRMARITVACGARYDGGERAYEIQTSSALARLFNLQAWLPVTPTAGRLADS